MDLVKGGSLTYSNRHQLRMTQTDPSVVPNDLIIRIIGEHNRSYYGFTHKNQFNRCVMELNDLNSGTLEELSMWFGGGGDDEQIWLDMFHYDGHEDDFVAWGMWYQWIDCVDWTTNSQGFSTGLLAETYKVKVLCGMSPTIEIVEDVPVGREEEFASLQEEVGEFFVRAMMRERQRSSA